MPNHPTLDASVQWRIDHGTIDLREPGYRGTAEAILDAGLATEVRRLISAGKEADLTGVDKLAATGIVHSDLSAFNILVHEGVPFFIDFSDAIRVDRTGGVPWIRLTQARDALVHGFHALGKHFHRYGLAIEADSRADRVVQSLDRFGVLSNRN